MALSAQDVHDKQFKLVRQTTGYDMDEVDAFLDEVEAELASLHKRLAAAEASAAPEAARPSQATGDTDTDHGVTAAARLLALAQRTADEQIAEAKRQAEAAAHEIQQGAREAVDALNAQRVDLEARVGKLVAFEADIRTRLRGYLETQLRDLTAFIESAPQQP